MARHTKDILNELLILQNKMETLYEECLNDSMAGPLLWLYYDDTILAKIDTGFPSYIQTEIYQ